MSTQPEYKTIQYRLKNGVAIVTLDRQHKLNSLDTHLVEELRHAIERVKNDSQARVLMITGAGRAFCTGADLSALTLEPDHTPGETLALRIETLFNPVVKEIVAKMDIQQVTGKSQEADDLIAAIAFQAREEGDMPVVIVTRDKDIEQIVSTQVTIFDPQTETLRTPGTVLETLRFGPGKVVEYLAMAGDASDNIPGIKGIGEIGAAKLLANYGSISGIYDNLESIPAGQRKKLQEGRAQVPLWVKLVTLDETAVLPFTIDELKLSRPNYEAAKPLFKKYGFRAIT